MTLSEIFEVIINFLKIISWPLVILIIFMYLKDPIKDFIKRMNKFKIKDVEASANVKAEKQLKRGKEISVFDKKIQKRTYSQEEYNILNKKYYFLSIYNIIFTGQINILKHLNHLPLGDVHENLERFYIIRSIGSYNFENYLSFLKNTNLIMFDEATQRYKITAMGREFLIYLTEEGLPPYKNEK